MLYQNIGRSGLTVSRLIVGSTMFGEVMDIDAVRTVLHRAWDLGVHTIDTGDVYAGGKAETMIGTLTKGRRDQVIICTKVGFRVGDTPAEHEDAIAGRLDHAARALRGIAPHDQGLSRQHIMAAVDASLRRLQTDYIDLYQIHRWDSSVPIEETLRALDDLIRAGKVRYIGCSNARGWQLYEALWTSDRCNITRFESMQVRYSMLAREPEQDVLPACVHANVSGIAFTALAGGALSGAHSEGIKPGTVMAQRQHYQQRYLSEDAQARVRQLQELAKSVGRQPAELALGAVLGHPGIAAATIGIQSTAELESLAAAASRPLEADTIAAVRRIFA